MEGSKLAAHLHAVTPDFVRRQAWLTITAWREVGSAAAGGSVPLVVPE